SGRSQHQKWKRLFDSRHAAICHARDISFHRNVIFAGHSSKSRPENAARFLCAHEDSERPRPPKRASRSRPCRAADQGGRYLLVVNKDNIVEQRYVELGELSGEFRVITSGLEADDRVVIGDLWRANPGSRLQPKQLMPGEAES